MASAACVSFSKNFGLYSERAGCVHASCASPAEATAVKGHLGKLARALYSNPPAFGARLVAEVLADPELNAEWRESLKIMSSRISDMRGALRSALEDAVPGRDWSRAAWESVRSSRTQRRFASLHGIRLRALNCSSAA